MLKRFVKNQQTVRYLSNSSWMLTEYALKIISGVFVGIYVARYLGPEQFGIISYALAIVTVFMAFSRLGMEFILVRDLARHPDQQQSLMATAFGLMWIAVIISILVLAALVFILDADPQNKIYIGIISTGMLFTPFLVIDYNFQSQVKAKYSSISKSLALIFTAGSKLFLVWMDADLFLFALAYAFDHIIVAILLLLAHFTAKQPSFFQYFNKHHIKPLLVSAWPMVLSALAITLYTRIDQLMIKNMLGTHDLGLYAAATKIYEGWLTVTYVISISLLPAIVKLKNKSAKEYEKNMTMLFSVMFWSSALVASFVTFFGNYIVSFTFGKDYLASVQVLSIVMWATTFSALGSISGRYLAVENMEKKIAARTILGLVANVSMNLFLIPRYGIQGAAIATLITLFITNYMINYFDKDLKQLVAICNNSITLKWFWNET